MQTVSISFFRFRTLSGRLWVFAQMQLARQRLREIREIGFFKLFGTGTGEGFTPIPNFGVYAILATWPDLATARRLVQESEVFRCFRRHADETATVFLSAIASRGRWDGRAPFETEAEGGTPAPIAVVTRATLKARHLLAFWRNTPGISATIRGEDSLMFKIGMGEVPWMQQVTFSIWKDAEAMKAFAYRSATHGTAIRGVRENGWFKEELYARFRVLGVEGTWQGRELLQA